MNQIVATTTEDVATQFEFTRDELRAKLSEDLPTAIVTTADYKAVMKALAVRRSLRGEIDSTRQSLNELALKHQRAVNSYAKELVAIVSESEEPLKRLKKAEDDRRAEEKRAKEEDERQAREEELRKEREVEEARLRAEREAEERRLAEERAKLEAEKAAAEAERKAAEESARKERERIEAERTKAEAEAAAERARLKAEREAQEAAQRAQQAKRDAEAKAERERLQREREELEAAKRKAAEEEAERQARIRAEQEKEERIAAALALPQSAWEAERFEEDFYGTDEAPIYVLLIGRTGPGPDDLVYLRKTDMIDARVVARRTEAVAARARREAEEVAVREQERKAELARRLDALKPDREKALAYVDALLAVDVPEIGDDELRALIRDARDEWTSVREEVERFCSEAA